MSNCLSCGTKIKDGDNTCTMCDIKYGQSHVVVSQKEYQSLRYKEMMYDSLQINDESKNLN